MANPVVQRIHNDAYKNSSYAGFGQAPVPGYPPAYDQSGYGLPTPTPMQAPERTMVLDDVILKTGILFAALLASAGVAWGLTSSMPDLTMPLWQLGMWGGLVLGLVIAFKRVTNPAVLVTYSLLEGLFIGALSRFLEGIYPGIVMTAVVATLATFGGMLFAYKAGWIRVTGRARKIFAMMVLGYGIFALVNIGLQFAGVVDGWGLYSGPGGWLIGLLGVGLASFSLAVDFEEISEAARLGVPQSYSWLMAHGLIVSLVWLYIEIIRLLAILRGND